ncbi:MAG: efflux RND transporter periplasmic adaptor subunit [Gemmatimonadota bacterium]
MRPRRVVSALVLCVSAGCGDDERPAPPADRAATAKPSNTALLSAESVRIAGFTTSPVTRSAWRDVWRVPARLTLDAAATEPIGSIVEGRIVRVYAMPGDRVRKGQVLVSIHSHEMMDARAALARSKAQTARAVANLRLAQSASERGERLLALKALSVAELERLNAARIDGESARDEAAAELTRAEEFLDHLLGEGALPEGYDVHWVLIRAPIDGLVVAREVQPGNVVLVGAPLLTVSRTTALTLVLQLPDDAAAAAHVGAPVSFAVSAAPGQRFSAVVTRVFPAMDTLTRTLEVQAAVRDGRGVLKPEMFAEAELSGAAAGFALSVPSDAIQAFEGDTVVITGTTHGDGMQLAAMPVRVGRRTLTRTEIVSGVDTSQMVVVNGAAVAKAEILKQRGGT